VASLADVRSKVDLPRSGGELEPIRVMIVDAETVVREHLAVSLAHEHDIEVAGAVRDGREAIALVQQVATDVVVLDVGQPRLDGIRTTRVLTEHEPAPAVLALTNDATDELALDAIRAGATGFCEKRSAGAVVDAVRSVAFGHAVIARTVLRALAGRVPETDLVLDDCTPREREVMALVAQGATNPEVCETLFIADSTVRTHIRSLRRKLGARTRAELVSRAYAAHAPGGIL
jgi:DNA-binding NarL/FixJ family response regulator